MTLLRDKSPPVAPFPFPTFAINKVEKLEKKLEEGCGRVSKLFSLMLFILCGGLGLGLTLPHVKKYLTINSCEIKNINRKSSIRSQPCNILDPNFPRLVLEVLQKYDI